MPSRASLERDILDLSSVSDRRVGGPGHASARRHLLGRLTAIGIAPFQGETLELPYSHRHPETGRRTDFVNYAGVIHGTRQSLPPILIGAHYDTVPGTPGADDNAAAVAIVLAIAEKYVHQPLRRDIVIALFDAEEPPFFHDSSMGSTRFYEDHCSGMQFACVIIMDLVGHDVVTTDPDLNALLPRLNEWLFVMGAESDNSLPAVVESAAARVPTLQVIPTPNSFLPDMSDHRAFRIGRQPYLFLSCAPGKYYHSPDDHPRWSPGDWISMVKIVRVQEYVAALLECVDITSRSAGFARPCDPVDFEIRMTESAVGSALPTLLPGHGRLRSRADLDVLMKILASIFVRFF